MLVYLAGFESQYRYFDLFSNMNVFCTAHYHNSTDKALTYIKEHKENFNRVVIDSGAFSYMNAAGLFKEGPKTETLSVDDYEKYLMKYIALLKKHWSVIDYFIEMDVQKLIGMAHVKRFREIFDAHGLTEKMMYVMHCEDGQKEWDNVLKQTKSKYVCFESIRKNMPVLPYGSLMKQCFEEGVKVHALAMTKPDFCRKYPFYSVDSSRWLNITKYGAFDYFDELKGDLRVVVCKREKLRSFNLPAFLSSTKRDRATATQKLNYSAMQYVKMQKYFTDLWNGRGISYEQ